MCNASLIQNANDRLHFTLVIKSVELDDKASVRVQLVNGKKFFMPSYSGHCVIPIVGGELSFSLPQLLTSCNAHNLNSRVLEFTLCNGGSEEWITCEEGTEILVETAVLTYKLCAGSGKNLVLRLNWKIPYVEANVRTDGECLNIGIDQAKSGDLVCFHRIERDTVCFDRETRYEAAESKQWSIPYRDFGAYISNENDMFCLYYWIDPNNSAPGHYCHVTTKQGTATCKFSNFDISVFKTKDKNVSIRILRTYATAYLQQVDEMESAVTICLEDGTAEVIRLHRMVTLPGDKNTQEHVFQHNNAHVFGGNTLPLLTWNQIHQREPMQYRITAEIAGEEHLIASESPYMRSWDMPHQTVTIHCDETGMTVRVVERENKIRLGILGTCMTRWAFSRKYTDAYRSVYDVEFSHFWPSAFSLVEKPIPYCEEQYLDYPDKEKPFVKREYEKTSFSELQQANCDYLLIDFFVDAIHGPRRMKDGKFIGYKAYAKDFYQDFLKFDTEQYHLNSNAYYEHWTEAADQMIDQLKKIVPENRIVLATGGLTHYFMDQDGTVKCFDGMTLRGSNMTRHSINALNYLWDKMNSYFISKMPKAHVLHMREYEYLAHDVQPANVRPYHFENNYYRTMSAELSRIILWDKQNNKS